MLRAKTFISSSLVTFATKSIDKDTQIKSIDDKLSSFYS